MTERSITKKKQEFLQKSFKSIEKHLSLFSAPPLISFRKKLETCDPTVFLTVINPDAIEIIATVSVQCVSLERDDVETLSSNGHERCRNVEIHIFTRSDS